MKTVNINLGVEEMVKFTVGEAGVVDIIVHSTSVEILYTSGETKVSDRKQKIFTGFPFIFENN